jgi:superfamily II DNA or RNA helicase
VDAINTLAIDEAIEISLPPLNYGPIKTSVGTIQCCLRVQQTVSAQPCGEVAVTLRSKETVYTINDGETVLITERSNLARPKNVDGVLHRKSDGSLSWKSHRVIDEMIEIATKSGWRTLLDSIASSWPSSFHFHPEKQNTDGTVSIGNEGLRPPQIGALHAIGAHWSLTSQPATVVMPTGTGKTETMLATLAAYDCRNVLVIVPTDALRSQTAGKFLNFGWLRKLHALDEEVQNPIVGIITKRPKCLEDLEIFERCHVVISTMSAFQGNKGAEENGEDEDESDDEIAGEADDDAIDTTPFNLLEEIAERVKVLFVDEAHHVAAKGWSTFRSAFRDRKVLQFTATPFRRDGLLVDGQVIFNYPLRRAQEENYFKRITFQPIYEPVSSKVDAVIAEAAIARLRDDLAKGFNHLMMVRCKNITKARKVHAIYDSLAKDLKPLLLHSKVGNSDALIKQLRAGESRIVVCVNMLGEGFDLPELKIAAIHDIHKSLAILLQFAGRFTRSSGENIGDATIIANIAEPNVSTALERLYSEDADWNQLLSELSSDAAKEHAKLIEFLQNAKPIVGEEDDSDTEISRRLLRPTLSTLVYNAKIFRPKAFVDGLPEQLVPYRAWLHGQDTLFFVTKSQPYLKWCRSKAVRDTEWALFVLHFDKARSLLYLSSSDHSSDFVGLATAVGADDLISGEVIFKSLGKIARLLFQNIGLKKHGRRNLSYAMYTGAQVEEALGLTEKGGSTKSNLSGIGWEDGKQVSIGCSVKGRIWSRDKGTIPEFNEWSEKLGEKLQDPKIDLKDLLASVLIPTEVATLPDAELLCMEWPYEIVRESEERVEIIRAGVTYSLMMCDIEYLSIDRDANTIKFRLVEATAGELGTFLFELGGENAFSVKQEKGHALTISIGRMSKLLAEFFSERPPLFRFVDLTELDANLHIRPQNPQELAISDDRYEPWVWKGVDITKESMWKDGVQRETSIQGHAAKYFIDGEFDVVFDDDASGEAADLVCLKLLEDSIRVVLVHCKFSGGVEPGERVKDVVEVASQAVRSTKWNARFQQLCAHIRRREDALKTGTRPTRFLKGDVATVAQMVKVSRLKPAITEILIVQPGLKKGSVTDDQSQVLAAALTYLKQTINVDLSIVCNS